MLPFFQTTSDESSASTLIPINTSNDALSASPQRLTSTANSDSSIMNMQFAFAPYDYKFTDSILGTKSSGSDFRPANTKTSSDLPTQPFDFTEDRMKEIAENFEKQLIREQSTYSYDLSLSFLSNKILTVSKDLTVKTLLKNVDYSDIVISEPPSWFGGIYSYHIVKRKNILEIITTILEVNNLKYIFYNDHKTMVSEFLGKPTLKELGFKVTFDNGFRLNINIWKQKDSEDYIIEFDKKMRLYYGLDLYDIFYKITEIVKNKQSLDNILDDTIDESYLLCSSHNSFLDLNTDENDSSIECPFLTQLTSF
jgi:hypothetical protein